MPRTKSFDEIETLDKARDVFWEKGYNGTPPQDILDGTGLSRSSLYDTYGDKHTLFVRSLRRYRQIAPQVRDESGRFLHPLASVGVVSGLLVMYLTGLLVSV